MTWPSVTSASSPPTWIDAHDIARPKIAESAGAQITDWQATRAPDDSAALIAGCVATPIPGWVDDMLPQVEGRTRALAGAAAERIAQTPIDVRSDDSGGATNHLLILRSANDLAGPRIGVARTFIGFGKSTSDDEPCVLTCFATCTARHPSSLSQRQNEAFAQTTATSLGCEEAVALARLDGSSPPPTPNIALRGVVWAVHHPRPTAFSGAILVIIVGILAIVLRRRPRSA